MDPDKYKLAPEALEDAYREVYDFYAQNHASLTFPRIAILSAQPGAGKSTVFSMIESQFDPDKKPVHIDIDETRNFNPRLEEMFEDDPFSTAYYTNADSWRLTKRLLDDSKAARNNIVYETTLRSVGDIEEIIKGFQSERYAVDLHALAVNAKTSVLGIHQRFEARLMHLEPARWTPINFHDEAYHVFPKNVSLLEKNAGLEFVSVYTRKGEVLYRNDKDPSKRASKEAIDQERNRIWIPEERNRHLSQWQQVSLMVAGRPDGKAKPQWYTEGVQGFLQEAELYAQAQVVSAEDFTISPSSSVVSTHHHIFVRNPNTHELFCLDKTIAENPMRPGFLPQHVQGGKPKDP